MSYLFGVDYYPEHWPKSRWATDAKMMREMGIQVVRMAEFSWAKWEPREGEFHFEELDEAIEILANEGIDCILGTPSAAPPAWIVRKNPEIQPLDARGLQRRFGGRHHDCQSNPVYRAHIRRFVTAFAAHYAKNPHVVGFQVDNELGNSHAELCFCPACEARFRDWLQAKYGDIETLNRCWGTEFWSQQYLDFSEIESPRETAAGRNPSQLLDWKCFCSDLICDFHKLQADILRTYAPDKFITHNLMGFTEKVSYYDLCAQLDFASHDQYPGGHFRPHPGAPIQDSLAAELDFIRSLKDKPFWIMEQQSGITGWEILGRTPRPGQLALWAAQCIAHGADTVCFFRWRSCTVGTEQYWHGILPHNGEPGRYFREIRDFMHSTAPVFAELQGAMPKNEAGILFSYRQEYAIDIQPHHPLLRYLDHMKTYYASLYRKNIGVDFLPEDRDFSRYPVLIAPLQFLMTPALAEKFKAYAENGGTLVLDMRAGIKDEHNIAISEDKLPGLLSDLIGAELTEYDCLREMDGLVRWDGQDYPCHLWSDILTLTGGEAAAVYAKEFYEGSPAIVRHKYGKGTVYYIGTQMSPALADRFVEELVKTGALHARLETPEGVEVTSREKAGKAYHFVLNHTDRPQPFRAPEFWRLRLGEDGGTLAPYAWAVYESEKNA